MDEQILKKDLEEGHLQWNFSLEAARDQLADGLHFGLEHPQGAETWELRQTQVAVLALELEEGPRQL